MFQDTVAVAAPVIANSNDLIMYVVTVVAGSLSGLVTQQLGKLSDIVKNLNEGVRLIVIGLLSFGVLKLGQLVGLTLPANPLGWSPIVVNSVLAAVLGWGVHKTLIKTPTPIK